MGPVSDAEEEDLMLSTIGDESVVAFLMIVGTIGDFCEGGTSAAVKRGRATARICDN